MNLNWSKWIILSDTPHFGQDVSIRIGESRTKTQRRSVWKAQQHMKEISHSPGHAEDGTILQKRTWEPYEVAFIGMIK